MLGQALSSLTNPLWSTRGSLRALYGTNMGMNTSILNAAV